MGEPIKRRFPKQITVLAVLAILFGIINFPIPGQIGVSIQPEDVPSVISVTPISMILSRYNEETDFKTDDSGNEIVTSFTRNGLPGLIFIVLPLLWAVASIGAGIGMLMRKKSAVNFYMWALGAVVLINAALYRGVEIAGILYFILAGVLLTRPGVQAYFRKYQDI